jgi:hypothetical protein
LHGADARVTLARADGEHDLSALGGAAASPVHTDFDVENHRMTALLPDDGKGLELQLTY